LREEGSWLVLLLRVEDFSEMKASQRNCWQAGDDCPGETPKEVGVYEETILGCLEEQRARLTQNTSFLEPVGLLRVPEDSASDTVIKYVESTQKNMCA
jgi:hypothetical protein